MRVCVIVYVYACPNFDTWGGGNGVALIRGGKELKKQLGWMGQASMHANKIYILCIGHRTIRVKRVNVTGKITEEIYIALFQISRMCL